MGNVPMSTQSRAARGKMTWTKTKHRAKKKEIKSPESKLNRLTLQDVKRASLDASLLANMIEREEESSYSESPVAEAKRFVYGRGSARLSLETQTDHTRSKLRQKSKSVHTRAFMQLVENSNTENKNTPRQTSLFKLLKPEEDDEDAFIQEEQSRKSLEVINRHALKLGLNVIESQGDNDFEEKSACSDRDHQGISFGDYCIEVKLKKNVMENASGSQKKSGDSSTGTESPFKLSISAKKDETARFCSLETNLQHQKKNTIGRFKESSLPVSLLNNNFVVDYILFSTQFDTKVHEIKSGPCSIDEDVLNDSSEGTSWDGSLHFQQSSQHRNYRVKNTEKKLSLTTLLSIFLECFNQQGLTLVPKLTASDRESNIFHQAYPNITQAYVLSNNFPVRKFQIYLGQSEEIDVNLILNDESLLEGLVFLVKSEVFKSISAEVGDITLPHILVSSVKAAGASFVVDLYISNAPPHLHLTIKARIQNHFKQLFPGSFKKTTISHAIATFTFSEESLNGNEIALIRDSNALFITQEAQEPIPNSVLSYTLKTKVLRRNPSSSRSSLNQAYLAKDKPLDGFTDYTTPLSSLNVSKPKDRTIQSRPLPIGWIKVPFQVINKYDNGNNNWLYDQNTAKEESWVTCYCSLAGYDKKVVKTNKSLFRGSQDKSRRSINLETFYAPKKYNSEDNSSEICDAGMVLFSEPCVTIGLQDYFSGQLIQASNTPEESWFSNSYLNYSHYLVCLVCRVQVSKIKSPAKFNDNLWVVDDLNSVRAIGVILKGLYHAELESFGKNCIVL